MLLGPADTVVLIASDGAGSATHSHVGADAACGSFVNAVLKSIDGCEDLAQLSDDAIESWVSQAIQGVADAAAVTDTPLRQLACTLVAVVTSPTHCISLHIGDGGIVARRGDAIEVLSWPEQGEYANTTHFVTDADALQRLRVTRTTEPVSDLAVFTDGLQGLLLDFAKSSAHDPFFQQMFGALRALPNEQLETFSSSLAEWLASESVCRRTDDDKTLLLASLSP